LLDLDIWQGVKHAAAVAGFVLGWTAAHIFDGGLVFIDQEEGAVCDVGVDDRYQSLSTSSCWDAPKSF
jgi:hypothetical protein